MGGRRSDAAHWRDELRRDITGLMLLKLAALALLPSPRDAPQAAPATGETE